MLACLGARHWQAEHPLQPRVKHDQSQSRHSRGVSGSLRCSLAGAWRACVLRTILCCEVKARSPNVGGLAAHLHILLHLRRCWRRVQLRQEKATKLLVHAWELQVVVTCVPRARCSHQQCALLLIHNCAVCLRKVGERDPDRQSACLLRELEVLTAPRACAALLEATFWYSKRTSRLG